VRFVDDLDGSKASGTVVFSSDGRAYEIDLSDKNATIVLFATAARRW
jgi:Lsr2